MPNEEPKPLTFYDPAITGPPQPLAARPDKMIGTCLNDKILIESLIGQGGMSVVYKGKHLVLNRDVAVKIILPGLGVTDKILLRLQQEAQTTYSLAHENLASVHDVGMTEEGLPYLVMDLAGGGTLAEIIDQGPMPAYRAVEIFRQVSAGLDAAHGQRVIHRDIKPGNIMVESFAGDIDRVKIVDFGIAKKVTENAAEIQKLTLTGEVFGTPLYMSPEQCRGEKLDERSDIYSLGCVMYETLTGVPPFKGDSAIATIMMHLTKEAPLPDKALAIPDDLVELVARCLEKKSLERFQSMAELHNELQSLQRTGKTVGRKRRKVRRSAKIVALSIGAVLAVLLIGTTIFFVSQNNKSDSNNNDGYQTIEACDKKLAANPNDFKGHFNRGRLFFASHDYLKAIADYNEALRLNINSATAYAARGEAYLALRNYAEALSDSNTALSLNAKAMTALSTRATTYLRLNNYQLSLQDANTYLARLPNDGDILVVRARDEGNLGDYASAQNDCRKAINIDKNNAEAWSCLANIYNHIRRFDLAESAAGHAIAINRDAQAFTARAYSRMSLQHYDQAQKDIESARQLQPRQIEAMIVQAQISVLQNKLALALEQCNNTIIINPKYAYAYKTRADIYRRLGHADLAQADLIKAAELAKTQ